MAFLSQVELELEAYGHGRERAAQRIARIEQQGKAAENSYANAVYRAYVVPLADAISAEKLTKQKGRGRKPAHLALLAPLLPMETALVVVRAALQHLLGPQGSNLHALLTQVARAAFHEHLLENFSELEPKLFDQLSRGFAKRMSRDERYRLNVVKDAARRRGLLLPEWDEQDLGFLGAWLLTALEKLGMLEVVTVPDRGGKQRMESSLSADCAAMVQRMRNLTVESSPYYLPCVEKPRDWVAYDDGGWHTPEMRRLTPTAVSTSGAGRDALARADLSKELAAINAMQATRWRINARVYLALRALAGVVDMGEVLAQSDDPRPARPAWMAEHVEVTDMTAEQVLEFRAWKRAAQKWHAKTKERAIKWGRYRQAMGVAERFLEAPHIHFVYFADFRCRKYALTSGVSPQGSDIQKALLEFADGAPLDSEDAMRWFLITGANRYGFDKDTLEAREAWASRFHEDVMLSAEDPTANQWWLTADKPLQFLAWCFEYHDLQVFGREVFLSRLSVGMDGSCNGLQNFSAMMRDEVGGRATNLVPAALPQDIYGNVAVRTRELVEADTVPPTEETRLEKWENNRAFRLTWLAHGINRTLVKRPVMTLPYGSTRFSCLEFIVADYLKEGLAPEFVEEEYHAAAAYISSMVWPAIGDVVKKAREAMDWLQASAVRIIADGGKRLEWVTPTGFPVVQTYWEQEEVSINAKLCGRTRMRIRRETPVPDKMRHRNGVSPNFIHSLDGSHLTLVACRLAAAGITDMHMVHDDFGVRPQDAAFLYRVIREEFVGMYEKHDPMREFQERYPEHTAGMPERGTLDLQLVKRSQFFFS